MINQTELKKYYIKQAGFNPDAPELVNVINARLSNIKLAILKGLDLLDLFNQDLIINDNIKIYFNY